MNFLTGAVDGTNIVVNGVALKLPSHAEVLSGRELQLGIRPQDLVLTDQKSGSLPGTVSLVELLGSEKLIEVGLEGGNHLTVQVNADHNAKLRETVHLRLKPDRVHLFDRESGEAVLRQIAA